MDHFLSSIITYNNIDDTTLSKVANHYKLPGISKIYFIDKIPAFVYNYYDGIFKIYQPDPFKEIGSFKAPDVSSFALYGDFLFLLYDDRIDVLSIHGYLCVFKDDFKNSIIESRGDMLHVKKDNYVKIYSFQKTENIGTGEDLTNEVHYKLKFKKSVYYDAYFENDSITVIANKKDVYVKTRKGHEFTVRFPDDVTCLIVDTLLTKILAGTKSGTIYSCRLDNSGQQKSIVFHSSAIKKMELSFCERYVYSLTENELTVWDFTHHILIESIENVNDFMTFFGDKCNFTEKYPHFKNK
ncbi:hypothetical protein SLOPH_1787 [Spraguea lophii 42_110]|uniref:Uncharacterized protein n=1 Tax=Spraguea lophii (strain 42_110) TaxID=1358809 RepID=S7W6D2_SPRLO|nr:hypothetical protein SLOPH_1787 [Spraguea lophii 42_110]